MSRDLKLIFIAIFFVGFGVGLYTFLYPLHAKELGANSVQIGIIYSLIYFWMALVSIPGGLLADRYELRKLILYIWAVMIPAPIIYYFARHWMTLLVGDFLSGLSLLNGAALFVYILKRSPAEKIGRSFTLVFSAFPIGMVISPIIGGYLAEIWGIRSVFLLSTFFFILSTLVLLPITPETPVERSNERKAVNLLTSKYFFRYVIFFSSIFLIYSTFQPFISPFLREFRHTSLTAVGLVGSLIALGSATLGPLMGVTSDKRGMKNVLLAGLAAFAFSLLVFIYFKNWLAIAIAVFFFGSADGFRSLANAAISTTLEDIPPGLSFGILRTVSIGVTFFGPYIGGWLYRADPVWPFSFAASALVLLFASVFIWGKRLELGKIKTRILEFFRETR